ncbi:hypothetical protein ASZ90_014095 [hydrocarbon metagenome]|uniref:Uncharacterized protein n=1 Tax=hydrocarbon metagenome TaxID=938273 RepID=A0A0W8F5Q7_9ZZZZ
MARRQYSPANSGVTKQASITPMAIQISQANSSGGLDQARYRVITVEATIAARLSRVIDFSEASLLMNCRYMSQLT